MSILDVVLCCCEVYSVMVKSNLCDGLGDVNSELSNRSASRRISQSCGDAAVVVVVVDWREFETLLLLAASMSVSSIRSHSSISRASSPSSSLVVAVSNVSNGPLMLAVD